MLAHAQKPLSIHFVGEEGFLIIAIFKENRRIGKIHTYSSSLTMLSDSIILEYLILSKIYKE